MKIEKIKNAVIENGGITLDSKTLENANLTSGYMVSISGYEVITTINDLTTNSLLAHARIAHALGGYVGLWLDNDKLYIDISLNIKSLENALKTGKFNNQLAIYDIVNAKEIRV